VFRPFARMLWLCRYDVVSFIRQGRKNTRKLTCGEVCCSIFGVFLWRRPTAPRECYRTLPLTSSKPCQRDSGPPEITTIFGLCPVHTDHQGDIEAGSPQTKRCPHAQRRPTAIACGRALFASHRTASSAKATAAHYHRTIL
jgi:hypothetical protein